MTGTAGTNISAFGAGDLEGDKKEDVLVLVSTSETETVIAKRGCNGEPLWEEHVNGIGWIPPSALIVGDLDGDGKDDVLVQMSTIEFDMASGTTTMSYLSYQYITFENNNLHIPETFSANSAFLAVNEMRQSQGKN